MAGSSTKTQGIEYVTEFSLQSGHMCSKASVIQDVNEYHMWICDTPFVMDKKYDDTSLLQQGFVIFVADFWGKPPIFLFLVYGHFWY